MTILGKVNSVVFESGDRVRMYGADMLGTVMYCSKTEEVARIIKDTGSCLYVLYLDLELVERAK